jgi:small-conductance mechanosensitive channel/CRP-like cAMP-binding protein
MSLTALFQRQISAAMGAALLLVVILLWLRPGDRPSVRNSLVLLGLCGIAQIVDAVARPMGGLATAAIAADAASILVGLVLVRLATIFAFRLGLPALGAHPARIAEELATVFLFAAWGFVWLRLAGVDLASLVTTSAIITAVIGFSMQQSLGNVLGGVMLQLDRSLKPGDWVRVDDVTGRIVEITWGHTAIETRNGETVVVPNGWLIQNRFTVIGTRADPDGPWRRWIRLNVDLSASPGDVCRVLEDAVRNATIENVALQAGVSAILTEVGPRYGSYALRYWLLDRGPDDATDSRVRMHVLASLARHGMKLGVPYQEQLDVHDTEAHRMAEAQVEHRRRVATLAAVDLFAPLSDAEREALAPHLVYAPFVAGDVITRQGAVAHWLYLVASGTADAWVEGPDGRRNVGTIAAGEVFGEMGMMTGAPRGATVTARTDVACYRLDKSGFATVVSNRPDIAEAISRILAAREAQTAGQREARGQQAQATPQRDMLERVRRFFGIEDKALAR